MRKKELLVGIFAAVTIVVLYFGFNFLKGIDFFATTTRYYVIYDNVNNLVVSNPVKVSGFSVGRVSKIRIMQNRTHSVLVEIDIDSDIKLGDSTKAILDSELLGGNYILLSIGDVPQPLNPGDTLLAEVAKGMFDVLTETAQPVASNVQSTLRKFDVVIDNLARNSQRLDSIFAKLQKTPDLLNATLINTNGKIDQLSGHFVEVATNLNASLNQLRPTLKNFETLSDSLKRMQLNKTLLRTQQTLASLNETLAKLKKGDNTVSKLMTEDSLYNNLNQLLVHMDSLTLHLNRYPKHFTAPLGKSHKKVEKDRLKEEEKKKAAAATKK
ncbi:MAG: MCE family protein [Bacteroidetes bacterium]|nr:MCE family protein [Bacteroidota bacterium]